MFTAPVKRERRSGFTLLEITLAVAILAMMSMAIYRFVATNLTALRISSNAGVVDAQYSGFLALLTAQLQNLPGGLGAVTGDALKTNERSRDEMTWICGPGPGLLTRYAASEYRVNLRIRSAAKGSDKLEIGLTRKPLRDGESDTENESWVPLLANVQDLQIRYFDPQVNSWVPQWHQQQLPHLVKVTIGRLDGAIPWEAIIAIERTSLL